MVSSPLISVYYNSDILDILIYDVQISSKVLPLRLVTFRGAVTWLAGPFVRASVGRQTDRAYRTVPRPRDSRYN